MSGRAGALENLSDWLYLIKLRACRLPGETAAWIDGNMAPMCRSKSRAFPDGPWQHAMRRCIMAAAASASSQTSNVSSCQGLTSPRRLQLFHYHLFKLEKSWRLMRLSRLRYLKRCAVVTKRSVKLFHKAPISVTNWKVDQNDEFNKDQNKANSLYFMSLEVTVVWRSIVWGCIR